MVRSFLLLIVSCSLIVSGYAQDDRPVTKFGGWYFLSAESPNYTLCFERERSFRESLAFTHGPRLDYHNAHPHPYSTGLMNFVVSYQFKYYPFSPLRGKPSRGMFLGLNPCYFLKVRDQYMYGPGIGFLFGYQLWVKNKVTAGLELSLPYMRNVNPYPGVGVLNNWYFQSFLFAKVGMRVGRKN